MIDCRELRIGNLVTDEFYNLYDGKFNTIITVESIDKYGINLYLDNDGNIVELMDSWIEPLITFNNLFPIPLTEEWLVKFGFYKRSIRWDDNSVTEIGYVKFRYVLKFTRDGIVVSRFMTPGSSKIEPIYITYIEAVHQLQNLYFELTGEELNIN